jgi:hypothetical protein
MMSNKTLGQMMRAATKRVRAERATVMAMRGAGNKEGKDNGNKDGGQ